MTSKRAFFEAKGHFNYTRQAILHFIQHIYENNSRFRPDNIVPQLLNEARRLFSDQRDFKAVKRIVELKENEFYEVLFGGYSKVEKIQKEIQETLTYALIKLTTTCANSPLAKIKRFDACPRSYEGTSLEKTYLTMEKIIGYEKDSLLLLDSYYLREQMDAKTKQKCLLYFATDDREHILSNKTKLEAILERIDITSFANLQKNY